MKLKELGSVCHKCALHLIDISIYPGNDCGTVNVDCFDEIGDIEKYRNFDVVNIYPNDENEPSVLRVEITDVLQCINRLNDINSNEKEKEDKK